MLIFEKQKTWYNYWRLGLLFPKVGKTIRYNEERYYLEDGREYGVDLATRLIYTKDDFYWSLEVRVLGLGFLLERQNGY